jgi:hypothetical protein
MYLSKHSGDDTDGDDSDGGEGELPMFYKVMIPLFLLTLFYLPGFFVVVYCLFCFVFKGTSSIAIIKWKLPENFRELSSRLRVTTFLIASECFIIH